MFDDGNDKLTASACNQVWTMKDGPSDWRRRLPTRYQQNYNRHDTKKKFIWKFRNIWSWNMNPNWAKYKPTVNRKIPDVSAEKNDQGRNPATIFRKYPWGLHYDKWYLMHGYFFIDLFLTTWLTRYELFAPIDTSKNHKILHNGHNSRECVKSAVNSFNRDGDDILIVGDARSSSPSWLQVPL